MPMMVREIKTPDAIKAVNRIKSSVRNDGLGMSFDIPKVFLEKREYMQSDEFLNDTHNSAMLEFGGALGKMYEITQGIRKQVQEVREEITKLKKSISELKK